MSLRTQMSLRIPYWPGLLAIATLWLAAVYHMHRDWMLDDSCAHGWLVSPLVIYLFSVRWRERPTPTAAYTAPAPWYFLGLSFVLLWLLREANPEWRFLGLALTGLTVLTIMLTSAAMGGTRWLRHFLAPALFLFTGVPWPSIFENALTGFLMPCNATLAQEILHSYDVPAVREGNLLTLTKGTLGVEEACSGIRSLQSAIMTAWFAGEIFNLRLGRRIALLPLSVILALFVNVARTTYLSLAAAKHGLHAAETKHDHAALTALFLTSGLLILIAYFWRRETPPVPPAARAKPPAISHRGPYSLTASVCLAPLLTSLWYGRHAAPATPPWHMAAPRHAPAFKDWPIHGRTARLLRHSDGWSAQWHSPTGQLLHAYYLEWNAGTVPPEHMNVHKPGGCLANLGITIDQELAPLETTGHAYPLHARLLRCTDRGRPLHVLYAVTSATPATSDERITFDFSYSRRLRAALHGQRNPGQRLLEIGLWDEPDETKARQLFHQLLLTQLRAE